MEAVYYNIALLSGGHAFLFRQVCSQFRSISPKVDFLDYLEELYKQGLELENFLPSQKLLQWAVQKALNSHTDKDMYTYLARDDKGEAKSFSSLHEDYKKMLDEMCAAEAMTVSEKELSKRRKGKEKADEERITLPEKVVLFEAHDKRLDEMRREEDTGLNEKEERSLAALAQVGKALSDKFASRSNPKGVVISKAFARTGYALALLKEIKIGSLVRLIGPPRISVENFWSTYLGVDEQGYPVLQDEEKRHRIDKDYLKKEWAYQDGQVEDRVVELREACALGQVEKVRKLLQAKFMLDGTHLCMAVQSANVEILNLLHEQNCPYNKHTLSDFCGRSTVQVYDWLKEHGYSLTKQVLISASKSCNTALLEMFWSKVN
ncbi:Ankyrin repeat-containing protein [Brazilian cedratvirus IHUMI]|uniref:Ankyrin repeat-containing protein n=1 Tax=Brazilian cedratvirus IHUMI TaxID=2126980 RepID=A0A2R8FD14_9VIRU|nr:Ankyrin repeat-containing protein [Brazilian cedratvirus IHUMI]